MHRFFESYGRSIVKALTWKIIATVLSFSVVYYQTRDIDQALKVSGIIFFVGLFAYYVHERIWNNIHWGKQRHDEQI